MITAMLIEQLRDVRASWARVEAAEDALPRDLSLADRVRVFEMLCEAGRAEMAATETVFGPPRQQAMIVLQARLRQLAGHVSPPRAGDVSHGG